jgi:methyl-accepting chemotaxis protein
MLKGFIQSLKKSLEFRWSFNNIVVFLKFFKISWSSLASQGTIVMILICVIPLSIVGWYFTKQTMESLTQAAIDKNNKVVDRIASDIGANIQSKKNFLLITSSADGIRGMQREAVGNYLVQVKPYYGSNEVLFVARTDGTQIFRTDNEAPVTIADREYFQKSLQGAVQFSDPLHSKVTNQLTIIASVPIYGGDNKVQGVLGANLSLQNVNNVVEQTRIQVILLLLLIRIESLYFAKGIQRQLLKASS